MSRKGEKIIKRLNEFEARENDDDYKEALRVRSSNLNYHTTERC